MINIFFASEASLNRYIKENKNYIKENFGKFGDDFIMNRLNYSHNDSRTL